MTIRMILRMTGKKALVLCLCILVCIQTGCGSGQRTYLELADTIEMTEETEQTETSGTAPTEEHRSGTKDMEPSDGDEQYCYVYVCGEVKSPGVYILKKKSRIYEAVALAGGMTEEANAESVNQAEYVEDGMMVRIPNQEEDVQTEEAGSLEESGEQAGDGRLDLNTATAAELMTLPGIGETKAKSILQYREESGGFSSVEDIMNVDGIKEGVYHQIRDRVKVRENR